MSAYKLIRRGGAVVSFEFMRADCVIRLEQLQNHTKPGRDPNKPMVALILSVLGALRNGQFVPTLPAVC